MRTSKTIIWDNVAKPADSATPLVPISNVRFVGVFIKVSGATNITIEVGTVRSRAGYKIINFLEAGHHFINITSFPFDLIGFRTSQAVTITIEFWRKT